MSGLPSARRAQVALEVPLSRALPSPSNSLLQANDSTTVQQIERDNPAAGEGGEGQGEGEGGEGQGKGEGEEQRELFNTYTIPVHNPYRRHLHHFTIKSLHKLDELYQSHLPNRYLCFEPTLCCFSNFSILSSYTMEI